MRQNKKTYIIAEAGVNHNGKYALAKKLVDAAKKVGADAVKFQTFSADRLATKSAPKARYQKETTSQKESQYEMLKNLELSRGEYKKLMNYCRKKKIHFMSSPFDEQSADLLEDIGVDCFKIPSGEIINIPFLKYLAKKKKKVILSTGMSTLAEVKQAMNALKGLPKKKISLLHCVTDYPSPYKEINLRAIETLKKAFGVEVGYSDHTLGIEVPIAAVAMGAGIIEKHLTLSNDMSGPDHEASLEPKDFAKMVSSIRHVESALGDGVKKPAQSEKKNLRIVRKSIVSQKDILKGSIIQKADIIMKRPATGIEPKYLDKIIGKKSKHSIRADQQIKWSHIE